ncbi:hypothetical protein [Alteromonas sp. CYL-A6]|uniref:hypothetical protein n=1 Tax=Alteromonas nitratireducens TaxID=3390813 RepID=UPI0034B153C6
MARTKLKRLVINNKKACTNALNKIKKINTETVVIIAPAASQNPLSTCLIGISGAIGSQAKIFSSYFAMINRPTSSPAIKNKAISACFIFFSLWKFII